MADETATPQARRQLLDPTQPLWLPPGSIRALLLFVLLITLGTIYSIHKWAPPELVILVTAVVKDYYNIRSAETAGK